MKAKRCYSCAAKERVRSKEARDKIAAGVHRAHQRGDFGEDWLEKVRSSHSSSEFRQKQSENSRAAWDRGAFDNEETRRKFSETTKENWEKGTLGSDEWKRRLSRSIKAAWESGAYDTPEYHKKRSEVSLATHKRGVFWKEETRERKSTAMKKAWQEGRIGTLEHRKRQSDGQRRAWANEEVRKRHVIAARRMWQKEDYIEQHSGSNHPFWRGGKRKYPLEFNASQRREIRRRDDFSCAICAADESNRRHDVHHIDYDRNNNISDNLITLCNPCHCRTTFGNRLYWQAILTPIARGAELKKNAPVHLEKSV